MIKGFVDFEFDLPGALLSQLVSVLDRMEAAQLTAENVNSVPEAQGVYQLFHEGMLVYIGKTDADAGLRQRLSRHLAKVMHRQGLKSDDVSFKAVRIFVFTTVDLEAQLLRHYRTTSRIDWNNSGFGSNDPGRNRERTRYKDGHFDKLFPIDIDMPIDIDLPDHGTAEEILKKLKAQLPYLFRFQNRENGDDDPYQDLVETKLTIGDTRDASSRMLIDEIVRQLPAGWQATLLPSHVILYKERADYPAGLVISRSG